ncbi:hypothetical protein, partial [Pseudomonas palmensis]
KLVDTPASGAGDLTVVEVRVFFWAPYSRETRESGFFYACNSSVPTAAHSDAALPPRLAQQIK